VFGLGGGGGKEIVFGLGGGGGRGRAIILVHVCRKRKLKCYEMHICA
jgi:hypothetical protein